MSEWIEHDGKSIPIDKNVKVIVRFRDGTDEELTGASASFAGYWHNEYHWPSSNWCHEEPCGADIVTYKVVG